MRAVSLAAVELRCPELESSRAFFTDTLGLTESRSEPGAVYLRCMGDEAEHTVVLRQAERSGLETLVLHTDTGADGAAGELLGPSGHRITTRVGRDPVPPGAPTGAVLNQPTPMRGVGIEPRRLAHVGVVAHDMEDEAAWWTRELGFTLREVVEDDRGVLVSTLAVTPQACDVMLLRGQDSVVGGLHHVAFAVDQRDTIARAALLLAERSIVVEVGLGQHGLGQLSRLYCFEPSGNRIALVHSPLLHLGPERPVVRWPPDRRDRALMLWGAPPPPSFFEVHT